ncbi:hypothetical protein [Sagittula sp. SSi028]|uniref:hypothetical protein n=1 Tax=Sagittula sp. SSi028 TaxID=3400636 RepID=UPI003AF9E96E
MFAIDWNVRHWFAGRPCCSAHLGETERHDPKGCAAADQGTRNLTGYLIISAVFSVLLTLIALYGLGLGILWFLPFYAIIGASIFVLLLVSSFLFATRGRSGSDL